MKAHIKKDEGGHDFIQIEWTGDAAKRSTVIRAISAFIPIALVAFGYSPSDAEAWKSATPDYDPYDTDGCTEIRDMTIYDGEDKRNGWMIWDETRDCCEKAHFRYVYFGFSIC